MSGTLAFLSDAMPGPATLDAFKNTLMTTLAADAATSSTSAANFGMSVSLTPGATYRVRAMIRFQSAATSTGLVLGHNFSDIAAGAIKVRVAISASAAASALEKISNTNFTVSGTGVSAANTDHFAEIDGVITVGSTGGIFPLRSASSVSGSAVTVKAGSLLVAERIA